MRIVFDTNVLVSAFIAVGTSREVLEAALDQDEVIWSANLLAEFQRVMEKKLGFAKREVREAVRLLQKKMILLPGAKTAAPVPDVADADDWPHLRFCETAAAGFFITGDKELLALGTFGKTKIIPPSQYWKQRNEE